MRKSLLLLSVCALWMPSSRAADPYDGKRLLEQATALLNVRPGEASNEENLKIREVIGYLRGFTDMALFGETIKGGQPLYTLPDAGVTPLQMAKLVKKYLGDHPEMLKKQAGEVMYFVLIDAFPKK